MISVFYYDFLNCTNLKSDLFRAEAYGILTTKNINKQDSTYLELFTHPSKEDFQLSIKTTCQMKCAVLKSDKHAYYQKNQSQPKT